MKTPILIECTGHTAWKFSTDWLPSVSARQDREEVFDFGIRFVWYLRGRRGRGAGQWERAAFCREAKIRRMEDMEIPISLGFWQAEESAEELLKHDFRPPMDADERR